jgi:hypothetical protein
MFNEIATEIATDLAFEGQEGEFFSIFYFLQLLPIVD